MATISAVLKAPSAARISIAPGETIGSVTVTAVQDELDEDDELKRWRCDLMEHQCVGTFTHDPASLERFFLPADT